MKLPILNNNRNPAVIPGIRGGGRANKNNSVFIWISCDLTVRHVPTHVSEGVTM